MSYLCAQHTNDQMSVDQGMHARRKTDRKAHEPERSTMGNQSSRLGRTASIAIGTENDPSSGAALRFSSPNTPPNSSRHASHTPTALKIDQQKKAGNDAMHEY